MHSTHSDDDSDAVPSPLTLEAPLSSSCESTLAPAPSDGSTVTPPSSLIIPSPTQYHRQRKRSDGPTRRRSSEFGIASSSSLSSSSSSGSSYGSFPTPFKCCGDFCDFILQQPLSESATTPRTKAPNHVARFHADGMESATALQLLFSDDERQLVGDHKLHQLLEATRVARFDDPHTHGRSIKATVDDTSSSSAPATSELRILTYKSIALAKANKQHLVAVLAAKQQQASGGGPDTLSPDKASQPIARRRSSLMDPTLAQSIRDGYRARIYGDLDGVANLYRQVRVCRNCYAIYTLLDRARDLTVNQPGFQADATRQVATKRHAVKAKWSAMVDDEVARKEKLYLRKAPSDKRTDPALASSVSAPSLVLPVSPNAVLPAILSPKGLVASGETKALSTSKSLATLPAVHLTTHNKERVGAAPMKASDSVVSMDKYLRGESKQIEERKLQEGQLFHSDKGTVKPGSASHSTRTPASRRGRAVTEKPVASVLLMDTDLSVLQSVHDMLTHASDSLAFSLEIESLTDPNEAIRAVKETGGFDLILVDRELLSASISGLEFAKIVRQTEVQRSLSSLPSPTRVRMPILCLSSKTAPVDLQLYKDTGMDGCIGKPINRESLVHTVQAALTKVLAHRTPPTNAVAAATDALAKARLEHTERRRHRRRKLEAATRLPFPALAETDVRDYTHGIFQLDSETSFPYCILGDKTARELPAGHETNTFFNLVVIHDLFDTWERLQILLNPIVTRYHGAVQILVWNYPGQAYTTWRAGTLLNNTYHCACFEALLRYVGPQGRGFLRDAPYYLVGFGNGGNIATMFTTQSPPRDVNTRALVLVNSFSFVDATLAQFLHDCLKVFACTPESRPDLPVYFHARFLFSAAYIARVTTPLALNLLTAVMNPITLDGRKALCHGALNHVDLRGNGKKLRLSVPFFNVCAAQDVLVNVSTQTQTLVDATGVVLVDSIGKVLRARPNNGSKPLSSVVWLASGHEVLQECKHEMLVLLEQLVTGFHELHDAPHASATSIAVGLTPQHSPPPKIPGLIPKPNQPPVRDEDEQRPPTKKTYEDAFLDRVLTTVNQVVPSPASSNSPGTGAFTTATNQLTSPDKSHWLAFQQSQTTTASAQITSPQSTTVLPQSKKKTTKKTKSNATPTHMSSWDPTTPAFERLSSNLIYKIGDGSKIYPDNATMPEVKEYMAWRVQRNYKRLQRMDRHARAIQRAFRAFFARTLAWRLKRTRCAIHVQRLWRAKLGRMKYHGMKREDWAVRLLQRHWRGKMGRNNYRERMQQYVAACEIQRVVRGGLARRLVIRIRQRRKQSATTMQRIVRQYLAKRRLFHHRRRRTAATNLQRMYRGHLGRRRFRQERDKFLFSKTQSQGITFGKQMLMEYKLYGTKLQSEVALLTSTKTQVETDAESVVREICELEEGIRILETEMHALAQLETEGLAKQMDEHAKWQLREQKMRLDREFTQMLAQIAARKETLSVLEEKLHALDKERLAKDEELKGLERKLVILLDEQQRELDKIKHKQATRSQLLLDLVPSSQGTPGSASSPSLGSPWPGSSSSPSGSSPSRSAIQGAAIHSASAFTSQQREEANSLMESTETMMKFGFMSMSMTYFSSMNMVRAMRKIGAHHMTLDSAAAVANHKWPEYTTVSSGSSASPLGFSPAVPPGKFPGQQPLQVAGWSVTDVGRWLDTLALAQYKRAFQDAAVDGALLLHVNDDDLKNTLGMEHRLHRKKVLTSVEQLREAERITMKRSYGKHNPDDLPTVSTAAPSPVAASPTMGRTAAAPSPTQSSSFSSEPASADSVTASASKMLVTFADFCTLVRHGKLKQIKEALAHLPDRTFDPLTVTKPFAPGIGTLYDDVLEKSVFHINKGDENGNSPLLLAAQNNNLKVAQFLLGKGANPNHQNKHGHTAGHYAMAYSFFDLGAWLLDPDKGGGRDDILNENGLTAYDGL